MKKKKNLSDLMVFAMLGTIMFISKLIMEFLPNIHPIAMFITVFTLVYRKRALIPIYMYVFLVGLYSGFNVWWVPYIYIWTILWAMIMLIPKKLSYKKTAVFSAVACAIHGLLYGILYAPAQALFFKFDFKMTVAWIIAGFPWDVVHMIGNIALSVLIIPLYKTLIKIEEKRNNNKKL